MITGTTYIKEALTYDFPLEQSIKSIASLCSEIICIECQSEDDTLDWLHAIKKDIPQLKIISGVRWDVGHKHERLRILSDLAESEVKTPWRLHIQADEVLHQDSHQAVRDFITAQNICDTSYYDSCFARRINLFGDFDHYVNPKIPNGPCGAKITRIAKKGVLSMGDDESLDGRAICKSTLDDIIFFHYSYVRKIDALIEKSINMQSWFHNDNNAVDKRLIEAKESGIYDPFKFISNENLLPLDIDHPEIVRKWVDERRGYFKNDEINRGCK